MAFPAPAAAGDLKGLTHIRALDCDLHALITSGVRTSPSFRMLLDRLDRSDVVVYVACTRRLKSQWSGQLTFVGSAGALRYVVVRLQPDLLAERLVSTLAHELRHALEIADTPSIVDPASMAMAYRQMGHWDRTATAEVFDTDVAVETGRQVWREMTGGVSARGE